MAKWAATEVSCEAADAGMAGCQEYPCLVLLVNDSLFARVLAEPVVQAHASRIAAIVLSRATTGSTNRLLTILRRASWRYLTYRMFVELLTRCSRRTVAALAYRHGIPTWESRALGTSSAETGALQRTGATLAVAIHFDQILPQSRLDLFPLGVLNSHASRLPTGRGISPALWAFARGDREIWVSLYRMDAGLDTGPIYEQFAVPVLPGESAFSMYRRVCAEAGARMAQLISDVLKGTREPIPQASRTSSSYSWPDASFDALLRRAGRRLIRVTDLRCL